MALGVGVAGFICYMFNSMYDSHLEEGIYFYFHLYICTYVQLKVILAVAQF
jgi:hypothetical protein